MFRCLDIHPGVDMLYKLYIPCERLYIMDMHDTSFLRCLPSDYTVLNTIKKADLTKGLSFGSSAMPRLPLHPPLSAPFSRKVWFYRDDIFIIFKRFLIFIDKSQG